MAITNFIIRKNQYFDSVFLMGINKGLMAEKGVIQSAVLMGTKSNKQLLADIAVTGLEIEQASANDLIVAVIAETELSAENALAKLDQLLERVPSQSQQMQLKTLQDGMRVKPNANMVVISLPGEFVAHEAMKALENDLNVFIFSSNVSVEDELSLKTTAREKGLLVMGPDCGTSIIAGKGLGFSDRVRKGPVGIIGPSGTGLQEITCLLHNFGSGVTHAIGTGSRDLKDEIGGITTFIALDMLEKDDATQAIAIVSKPAGRKTLDALLTRLNTYSKPAVACFLGETIPHPSENEKIQFATTIDETAVKLIKMIGGSIDKEVEHIDQKLIDQEVHSYHPDQKFVRGLFAGGTFCYQSQYLFQQNDIPLYSNEPLKSVLPLPDPENSVGNTLIDMGDERFTLGKPHPMIDGTMRSVRISQEANDPQMMILLLDFILGYNASNDPVGEAIEVILDARRKAETIKHHLTVVASLTGTEGDPQDINLQHKLLDDAGVFVFPSNASATKFCLALMKAREKVL